MEEIKENEYIRTKKKGIFKVLSIKKTAYGYLCGTTDNDNILTFTVGKGGNAEIKNDIVKHNSNIIDLIEVGDYVNGSEVVAEKYKNYDMNFINVDSKISFGWGYGVIPENDIKSILTKEQFASMEYRLEE